MSEVNNVAATSKWLLILALLMAVFQFSACSKKPESGNQPAKPTEVKNQTYRMIGGRSVVAIVSSDELEIRQGGENLVCKYTKQDNKLRVIVNALGTTTAKYFDLTQEGLVDEGGDIYYEPETFQKITAQIELNSKLWAAVEKDDDMAIEELIRMGAAVETRDSSRTALVLAAEQGLTNALKVLLKHGAAVNQTTDSNGETVLWRAIESGHSSVVQLLLQHGATPTSARQDGTSPLNLAASLGGGWFGSRRTPEHDAIATMLVESTSDITDPALKLTKSPFTILAVEANGSTAYGGMYITLIIRTVGDRPVGDATVSVGDYTGYIKSKNSDNPHALQVHLDLNANDVGTDKNIPVTISLNSIGGKKDEVFFVATEFRGKEMKYLRPPWTRCEPSGSQVGILLDEIPKDVATSRAQREQLQSQYSKTIIGFWKDQDGDMYEYKADGIKIEKLKSGRESSESWSIKGDIIDCGSWQAKIIVLNNSHYEIRLPDGRMWSANRVPQSVIDADRAKAERTRKMLVGSWRDEEGTRTFAEDGQVIGKDNRNVGTWSVKGDTFTYNDNEWKIVELSDSSVFMEAQFIFGGDFRATKVADQSLEAERAKTEAGRVNEERYTRLLVGTWSNEVALLTYLADGTGVQVMPSGEKIEISRWTISGDRLSLQFPAGTFGYQILNIDEAEYSIRGDNGKKWHATRIPENETTTESSKDDVGQSVSSKNSAETSKSQESTVHDPVVTTSARSQVEQNYTEEREKGSGLKAALVGRDWSASTSAQLSGIPKSVAFKRIKANIPKSPEYVLKGTDLDAGTIKIEQPVSPGRKLNCYVTISPVPGDEEKSCSISLRLDFLGGMSSKKGDIIDEFTRLLDVAGGLIQ